MTEDEDSPRSHLKKILVVLGDPRLPDKVKRGGQFNPEDMAVVAKLKQTLALLTDYQFIYLDNHQTLAQDIKEHGTSVHLVLNFCDEGFFNNPRREKDIPEILEKLDLPYSGAGAECMQVCFDKSLVNDLANILAVPIPQTYIATDVNIKFPVIMKPALADGGLGITSKSLVHNHSQLIVAYLSLRKLVKSEKQVLIQEFLSGADLSIGLIGNGSDLRILPIIEEDYSALPADLPQICGYEAKWLPDSPYWQIKSKPARLTPEQKDIIESGSKLLFARLDCRDYARFDWRLSADGQPKLLEANPNCGWCWDGHLAKMANLHGWSYAELLVTMIQAAEKRYIL